MVVCRFQIWRQILLERLLNFAGSSLVVSALPLAINLRLTNVLAFSLFCKFAKKAGGKGLIYPKSSKQTALNPLNYANSPKIRKNKFN